MRRTLNVLLGFGGVMLMIACVPQSASVTASEGGVEAVTLSSPAAVEAQPVVEPTASPFPTPTPEPPAEPLFTLASDEPVIEAGQGGDWASPLHNAGAVVFYDGLFHMFRNGYPALPGNAEIGYATSPDGLNWIFDEGGPVFRTDDVPYADEMIMASSAQVEADGTWVLYFLIWDSPNTPGAIGRATAPAPTGPWTPDPAPVLVPGSTDAWDSQSVTQPVVLPDDLGGYRMYYTGLDADGLERIGLATSPDGIIWTKYDDPATGESPFAKSDPVLVPGEAGAWDEGGAARSRVVSTPDGYVMVYRAPSRLGGYSYGLALSGDGVHWARANGNPFLISSDLPRNAPLFFPTLAYHDSTYYFFIESYFDGTSHVYLLTCDHPLDRRALTGRRDNLSAANVVLSDIANQGDSSDLEIHFEAALKASQIDAYHVMLVKAETVDAFDEASAGAVPADRVVVIQSGTGADYRLRFPPDVRDTDGDPIIEGIPYVAHVLSVGEDIQSLSLPSRQLVTANVTSVHTLVPEFPCATGGLAVDAADNLYVANIGRAPARRGSEIYRITPDGEVSLWVEGQELSGASGNTFDPAGNLIQSGFKSNAIYRISPDGQVEIAAEDHVQGPVGVALADDGILFVANCGADNVLRIAPDGETTVLADGPVFACPNGITLDEAGNVYVLTFSGGRVIQIAPDGATHELARLPGGNGGHLLYHEGLLYVVSRGSNQVFTLTLDGTLTLLAGTGDRGHLDGPAESATFSLPNDLIFSPDGRRLYVNEVVPVGGNANLPSVIRVIELPRGE